MKSDVDMLHLAQLIDAALCSDKPATQRALQNFLMVASIAESHETKELSGDFSGFVDMLNSMKSLEREVRSLSRDVARLSDVVRNTNTTAHDHWKWMDTSSTPAGYISSMDPSSLWISRNPACEVTMPISTKYSADQNNQGES